MFAVGEIVSHPEMCIAEGRSLQQGMTFRAPPDISVLLMSARPGAPYRDRIEDEGRVMVYEGHDVPRTRETPDPKSVDQRLTTAAGTKTSNGLFYDAAIRFARGQAEAALVHGYEKVRPNIWVFNGLFRLADARREHDDSRYVFRFRLELIENRAAQVQSQKPDLPRTRLIPSSVKRDVWKRDGGRCVECGSAENLHFDHVIPYSKGGSSLVEDNVQLLCARHNLGKQDRIE